MAFNQETEPAADLKTQSKPSRRKFIETYQIRGVTQEEDQPLKPSQPEEPTQREEPSRPLFGNEEDLLDLFWEEKQDKVKEKSVEDSVLQLSLPLEPTTNRATASTLLYPRSDYVPSVRGNTPIIEVLEATAEVATRVFKNTMSQRAPPKGPAHKSLPATTSTAEQPSSKCPQDALADTNVDLLYEAILEMLDLARAHRGALELKVDLGQILLINLPETLTRPFLASTWETTMRLGKGNAAPPEETFTTMYGFSFVEMFVMLTVLD
ncbi:MAG: hypothetical protein M1838_003176 [Thelocarpon superellum]|nr:MAG: hypothetical protein M1838_003176 [Thelocarpon superellum]